MEENKTLFAEPEETQVPVESPVDAPEVEEIPEETIVEDIPAEEPAADEPAEEDVPLDRNIKLCWPRFLC